MGTSRSAWLSAALLLLPYASHAETLTGPAAYGDWHGDAPGVTRQITAADLPAPYASRSAGNAPGVDDAPADAALHVPPGFTVAQFASGFDNPRLLRVAPNGDIFLSETSAGRVHVLRAADGASAPERNEVFARGLDGPFGIAFYPPGPDPHWVYVATNNTVIRFPYRTGDLTAAGRPETIVAQLSANTSGHSTRDVQFSNDGTRMFVSIGSDTNVAASMPRHDAAQIATWEQQHGLGAAWGGEADRAELLVLDPQGGGRRSFATGIRNCVGLAVHPATGDVWCATNERDGLGDNLPPDYVTRVREGAFYGWPWYYIGDHEDPRHKGERPDLPGHIALPDVLLQPHSAPLQITFYPALSSPSAFGPDYTGSAFVALHGSWNRAKRTGYKIVRIPTRNGVPTGAYEDFLIGFVIDDSRVWARPVGVAVAHDGALLVTEDGNGTIWRVARNSRVGSRE